MGSLATESTSVPPKSTTAAEEWEAIRIFLVSTAYKVCWDWLSNSPQSHFLYEYLSVIMYSSMAEAQQVPDNTYPQAMTLCTIRKDGGPSARTVLMRGLDEYGFKMYWDHRSRKTAEIEGDNRGALVFCWTYRDSDGTVGGRQVRIEGFLEKLSEEDNTEYFNSEPLLAKFRATACHQSRVVTDGRENMLKEISDLKQKVQDGKIELTKPAYWGGFRLVPQMIEFYQGQRDTINDRIRFRKVSSSDLSSCSADKGTVLGENGWVYERLEP